MESKKWGWWFGIAEMGVAGTLAALGFEGPAAAAGSMSLWILAWSAQQRP